MMKLKWNSTNLNQFLKTKWILYGHQSICSIILIIEFNYYDAAHGSGDFSNFCGHLTTQEAGFQLYILWLKYISWVNRFPRAVEFSKIGKFLQQHSGVEMAIIRSNSTKTTKIDLWNLNPFLDRNNLLHVAFILPINTIQFATELLDSWRSSWIS